MRFKAYKLAAIQEIGKTMKVLRFVFLMLVSTGVHSAAGDQVTTSNEVVGEVRVSANGVVYFVSEDGNWSAPNCPNAKYVYFRSDYVGGDKTYSAALASKVSKTPITFKGVCGDVSGNELYIQINNMTF